MDSDNGILYQCEPNAFSVVKMLVTCGEDCEKWEGNLGPHLSGLLCWFSIELKASCHCKAQGDPARAWEEQGCWMTAFSVRLQVLPCPQGFIHHRINTGGVPALFALYALISDAGVVLINLMELQRAPC